jgi:hypothetical protein
VRGAAKPIAKHESPPDQQSDTREDAPSGSPNGS